MTGMYEDQERLEDLQKTWERLKGQEAHIRNEARSARREVHSCDKTIKRIEEAAVILQTVAKQTQQELEYHLSEMVSLCLSSVFDKPYEFKVEFVVRSERTEVDMFFERDGNRVSPMDESGDGPLEVAAFALRLVLWNISRPRTRPLIILDEPFKSLHNDVRPKANAMIRLLSKKLGLQILMITHSDDLAHGASKIFRVSLRNKISHVEDSSKVHGKMIRRNNEKRIKRTARSRIRRTTVPSVD